MKHTILLCLVIGAVVAQQDRPDRPTPRPGGVETPTRPSRCSQDSFAVARTCHMDCLRVDSQGCPRCDTTCNTTLSTRQCPDIRDRCTLGCTLARNSETRCPECTCEEPDDDTDDGNPCRVNATVFATRANCNLRCIRRRDDQCFMCDTACNDDAGTPEGRDECGVRDRDTGMERECSDGSVCLLEGVLNRCQERPGNGDECEREDPRDLDDGDEDDDDDEFTEELDEDDRDFFTRVEGAADRLRAFSLQNSAEIEVRCSDGHRCSSEGRCVPVTGPCVTARQGGNSDVECDEDGNFEPLQCRRMNDGTHTCRCVHPRNGSMVPNSMRSGITEREDAPDCESRVFRRCNYRQGERNFTVRHGETFVNRQTCMRCRCNDGQGMDCRVDSQVDCRRLNPGTSPQDCTRGNIMIEHGTRRRVGSCNMCGCNNGRLICTDVEDCENEDDEDDEDERRCDRCQDAPKRLVCGRDGRTYRSRCIAMNCSRLRDDDVIDGPCSSQPVCELFPCRPGLACIPLGGRSCLRDEGCTPDERRICVNRTALRCRVSNMSRDGFDISEEDVVCGSDRRTYPSICHMIQRGPRDTRVAHAGRCDREECSREQVCGTDGVTYDSTCHLRTQSANAQVDYRGTCMEDREDENLGDNCRRVREAGRCENNEDTCERRVRSSDGCCPVCGGITTLAIDREALDEYSRATDSNANLDEFMARMTRDVISDEVRRRCNVEVTHVRNSTRTNVEVKMMAKNRRDDADFCHTSSKDFADKINDGTDGSDDTNDDTPVSSTLPVEASFASAAVAAPLIADDGASDAPGLVASCLAVLGAALMAALF